MATNLKHDLSIINALEEFLKRRRPPEDIRAKLDIGYKIDHLSIIIHEIRPDWKDPQIIRESPAAKATFVISKNQWKVYWMRADLKWHAYPPKPVVKSIQAFLKLVEEDTHACFWG